MQKVTAVTLLAIWFSASLTTESMAAEQHLLGSFRYDILSSVESYDLWHSANTNISSSRDMMISYYELDNESTSRDGDWIGQAIVLAATTDLGVQPVGIKLWSKISTTLQTEESQKASAGPAAVAIVAPRLRECAEDPICAQQTIKITANENGQVFVGDALVGKIE